MSALLYKCHTNVFCLLGLSPVFSKSLMGTISINLINVKLNFKCDYHVYLCVINLSLVISKRVIGSPYINLINVKLNYKCDYHVYLYVVTLSLFIRNSVTAYIC